MISEPNLQLHFTIKEADKFIQPKIDPSQLDALNDDCLLNIASYLNIIDIVSLTNAFPGLQTFKRQVYRKNTHFRYGAGTGDPFINESNLETVLQEIGCYIESIDWTYIKPSQWRCLSKYCPNVITLKLVHPSRHLRPSDIKKNENFFANIELLDIVAASFYDTATMQALVSSSKLKALQLTSCYNMSETFLCTSKNTELQCLEIRDCPQLNCVNIFDFVQNNRLVKFSFDARSSFQKFLSLPSVCLSELEELELDIFELSDATLATFNFSALRRLTHLTLTCCGKFRNCNIILTALSQIPGLVSFSIDGMHIDAYTLNFLGLLKNLRKIRLNYFHNEIGSQFYTSLHAFLPEITALEITIPYFENVQSTTICEMISSFNDLEYFGCNSTSWQLLEMIMQKRMRLNRSAITIGVRK